MKINIAEVETDGPKLRLVYDENNTVVVQDDVTGYYLVGFKVVGGAVSLIRFTEVSSPLFNTNDSGQVQLVD